MLPLPLVLLAALASPAPAAELPSIDTPLRTGLSAKGDAAVVIGVENYVYLPPATYAARDAEAMYQFLVYTRGVPVSRVTKLTGGTSRGKIRDAVSAAGASVGPGGTVWVYFAGHGSASPSTRGRLLLPENTLAEAEGFDEAGVPVADLQRLAGAGGGEVMLITDACFTGAGRQGATLLSGGRSFVPGSATAAGKTAQWDAAQPNQIAGPLDAVQHGAFTYFAIGAMRGWADGQVTGARDGVVTSEEAQLYVDASLKAIGMRDQDPSLVGATAFSRTLASGATERAPALDAAVQATTAPPALVVPRTGDAKVQLAGKDMDFAALAAAAQQASADAAAEKVAAEAAAAERARAEREAAVDRARAEREEAATAVAKAARAKELQEELARRLAAERRAKMDAAAAEVRAAATRDYAAIAALVSNPTPEGSPVLEAWLARYGSVKVTVDQQSEGVEVPEATTVLKTLGQAGSGRDWASPSLGLMKRTPAVRVLIERLDSFKAHKWSTSEKANVDLLLKQKPEALRLLVDDCLALIQTYQDYDAAAAALYVQGAAYFAYADLFYTFPVPAGLSEDEKASFQQELDARFRPIRLRAEDTGKALLMGSLERARIDKRWSEWNGKALQLLHDRFPLEYAGERTEARGGSAGVSVEFQGAASVPKSGGSQ